MSELSPNDQQQALIDGIDGTYLVDAGAGTGKTFALTERYSNIVDTRDVGPADVLLVTYTRSAAREMKDRVVSKSSYSMRDLVNAPIQTFHSHCHDLLTEYGSQTPQYLGIAEQLTAETQIVSDETLAEMYFTSWYREFTERHPEFADFFRIIRSPTALQYLTAELAAKGIFPTNTGWYRNGESLLRGDREQFEELFAVVNAPRNSGRKQSELRSSLSTYGSDKRYIPEAPSKSEIRGERGSKQIDPAWIDDLFSGDRDDLIAFIHAVYFSYLRYTVRRNYLSFGFLQLFAYVLLLEEESIRQEAAFPYVMVDEFQDTSEIQFKLALLLTGGDNFCAVGDWKQSIYSFQYADVDNIRAFQDRLSLY